MMVWPRWRIPFDPERLGEDVSPAERLNYANEARL